MAVKKKFPYRSAFVACNGGCHVTEGSSCSYGCIACGKCVESCKFGAIHLNEHGVAEVDEEKCIACGRCIVVCPARARRFGGLLYKIVRRKFVKAYSVRKEPDIYV